MRALWIAASIALATAADTSAWLVRSYDSASGGAAEAVLFEPNGDVISAGHLDLDSGSQIVVRRHASADGAELWRYAIDGTTDVTADATLHHDGAGHIVANFSRLLPDNSRRGVVLQLDPSTGAERWRFEIPNSRFHDLAVDDAGDVIAVGLLGSWPNGPFAVLAVKISGVSGAALWRVQKPGDLDGRLYAVAIAPNGDVFVGGNPVRPQGDYLYKPFSVLRLARNDGAELWWQSIFFDGVVRDIAVDSNGDVVAVGTRSGAYRFPFLAAKFAGGDGALLWQTNANLPTDPDWYHTGDDARSVILDPNGDVFVAGSMSEPGAPISWTSTIVALRLRGSDGLLLWRHFVRAGSQVDYDCCLPRDLAWSADGDLLVLGARKTYINQPILIKLASDTGAERWWRSLDFIQSDPSALDLDVAPDGTIGVAAASLTSWGGYVYEYSVWKRRSVSGLTYFPGCGDDLDNDGDGVADEGNDQGCSSASDASERSATIACDDEIDNDGDGFADFPADPQCHRPGQGNEAPTCDDGIDNDADGLVDFPADPGCAWIGEDERAACQDGIDNDGDGAIDFDGGASWNGGVPLRTADPECDRASRWMESSTSCGLGAELAALVWVMRRLRERRRRSRLR